MRNSTQILVSESNYKSFITLKLIHSDNIDYLHKQQNDNFELEKNFA